MINVAVLGSTGSIGTQTLDVIATEPERFRVASLSAHGSVEAVAAQARRVWPKPCANAWPDTLIPCRMCMN